jgi:hypothetical protein
VVARLPGIGEIAALVPIDAITAGAALIIVLIEQSTWLAPLSFAAMRRCSSGHTSCSFSSITASWGGWSCSARSNLCRTGGLGSRCRACAGRAPPAGESLEHDELLRLAAGLAGRSRLEAVVVLDGHGGCVTRDPFVGARIEHGSSVAAHRPQS